MYYNIEYKQERPDSLSCAFLISLRSNAFHIQDSNDTRFCIELMSTTFTNDSKESLSNNSIPHNVIIKGHVGICPCIYE